MPSAHKLQILLFKAACKQYKNTKYPDKCTAHYTDFITCSGYFYCLLTGMFFQTRSSTAFPTLTVEFSLNFLFAAP